MQQTYRSVFRRDEQRRSLRQDHRRLPRLLEQLNMPLHPRLAPLHLDRLRPQHQEAPRRRRLPVVDVQIRRHRDVVRQRLEAAPRQPLVQHRRQHAPVHDPRVSAQVLPDVRHRDHLLPLGVVPREWRHRHLVVPEQRAAREAALAVLRRHLHVRARLGEVGALAELGYERMGVDEVLDPARLLVRLLGREEVEALFVGVEAHALVLEGVPCRQGAGRAEDEAVEREGQTASELHRGFWQRIER